MSNFLYLIRCGIHYKIGIARDISDRLAQLQTGNPVTLELMASYEFDNAEPIERSLHQKFSKKRTTGEWFALTAIELSQVRDICSLLGGQQHDIPSTALEEDIELAEEIDGGGERDMDFNGMIAAGWRIEVTKRGKRYHWRRGSGYNREHARGGTFDSLPPEYQESYKEQP